MIREELSRLFKREERHSRLLARAMLAFGLSAVVFVVGTVLIWILESGQRGGDIHGFGDAAFFTAVQLLTVSSQIRNPLTTAGKIVDVGLEVWAIFVVTAVAGSFATFFSSGDSQQRVLFAQLYQAMPNSADQRQFVAITIYGVCAVTFMMTMYALERRGRRYILGFAVGCVLSSAYGFLSGAWPFGVVELVWSGIAVRRYFTELDAP